MKAITRWLVTGFMAFAPLAAGADLTGKVTGVAGGDKIKVLGGVERIKVQHQWCPGNGETPEGWSVRLSPLSSPATLPYSEAGRMGPRMPSKPVG